MALRWVLTTSTSLAFIPPSGATSRDRNTVASATLPHNTGARGNFKLLDYGTWLSS